MPHNQITSNGEGVSKILYGVAQESAGKAQKSNNSTGPGSNLTFAVCILKSSVTTSLLSSQAPE